MKTRLTIFSAAVLFAATSAVQAALIEGTWSISGDVVVTGGSFTSPTDLIFNNGDDEGITTGNMANAKDFANLIPALTVFYGGPSTIGGPPYNDFGGGSDVSGGFLSGSIGGTTVASGTQILATDDGSDGRGGTGVRLFVTLLEELVFQSVNVGGQNFLLASADVEFSTNDAMYEATRGEFSFSSQQSGGSLENTFSASFSTEGIPVASPLALFAFGLAIPAFLRRRAR
jgi:hypothetical protein